MAVKIRIPHSKYTEWGRGEQVRVLVLRSGRGKEDVEKGGGKREGIKRERGGGEKKKRGGGGGKQRWEKEAVRERERG